MSTLTQLPPATPPVRSNNPFETARLALIKKLLEMTSPPAIPVFPTPGHFASAADFMREVAGHFDEMMAAIGHEVADNATCRIDIDLFRSPCMDGIAGNATFECERAAEALLEEREEMMRAS